MDNREAEKSEKTAVMYATLHLELVTQHPSLSMYSKMPPGIQP